MEEREERLQRLKRLKRRRMFTVIGLCAILGCLVGGYYLITLRNKRIASEEAKKKEEMAAASSQETEITTFLLKDVARVAFSNEEASYEFFWEENESIGSWIRKGEEDFPTNEEKLQNIMNSFCELSGAYQVDAAEVDTEDYGLKNTSRTIKLTLNDGTEHSFRLGDETPYAEGYYLLYENTGKIYVVAANLNTQLTTKAVKLVQGETFPSAEPESITELRIEVRDGETISYVPETAEDGTVTYPPIYYDSMRFVASTIQEYNCEDFGKYGLDDPYVTVTIDYMGYVFTDQGMLTREPCTMVLEIGDKTVSDNYYVRVDKSNFVYIMIASHAQKYLPE